MLTFRKANLSDASVLFEWVNEPSVRGNSFLTQIISWEDHIKWLDQRLSNPDFVILLFFEKNLPIGQVRFEKNIDTFVIDYSIAKTQRGKGFGLSMLKLAVQYLRETKRKSIPLRVLGEVKITNMPSAKIFRNLGFDEELINYTKPPFYRFSLLLD